MVSIRRHFLRKRRPGPVAVGSAHAFLGTADSAEKWGIHSLTHDEVETLQQRGEAKLTTPPEERSIELPLTFSSADLYSLYL
jgi:hypothetical protein